MNDITTAISYIHLKDIVHGDIKPQNIVVDKNDVAKLVDYATEGYTKKFVPPSFDGRKDKQSKLTDIYALGKTLMIIYS